MSIRHQAAEVHATTQTQIEEETTLDLTTPLTAEEEEDNLLGLLIFFNK